MTVNARNIELMIRRLAASPLAEAQECSRQLYDATQRGRPVARPLHGTDGLRPRDAGGAPDAGRGDLIGTESPGTIAPRRGTPDAAVRLLDATPEADEKIVAALLHGASHLPLAGCREIAARMDREEQEALIKTALRQMKAYDAAPREFEHVGLTFELTISATCFAQMKRHRMASITVQEYDPALGVTVPPAITAIGMENTFREICARTEETWEKIRRVAPAAAAYILTNAHRRRVAMTRQRPRALPPRPRPGGPPRPVGHPGNGRADGRRGAGGHAAHADAGRGKGRLRRPLRPGIRRRTLTDSESVASRLAAETYRGAASLGGMVAGRCHGYPPPQGLSRQKLPVGDRDRPR